MSLSHDSNASRGSWLKSNLICMNLSIKQSDKYANKLNDSMKESCIVNTKQVVVFPGDF